MSSRSPTPSPSLVNATFDRHPTTVGLAATFGNHYHNDGGSNRKAAGKGVLVFRRDNNNNIHRLDSDKENTPNRHNTASSNVPNAHTPNTPKALSAKKSIANRNINENIDPNTPNSSSIVYKNKSISVSASSPLKSSTKSLKAITIGRRTPSSTGSSSEKNRESVYGVVRKPLKEKKNGANNKKGASPSAHCDLKDAVAGSAGSGSNVSSFDHDDVDDSFENLVAAKNIIATVDDNGATSKVEPTKETTSNKIIKLQQSAKEKDGLIFLLKGTVHRKKQLLVSSQHEADVLSGKLRSSNEHIVALKREVDHLKSYLKASKDDSQRQSVSVGTSPLREETLVTTVQYTDTSDKCTNTSLIEDTKEDAKDDDKELDELSTQLAIQRRYNERLEDQMRSLVESQFAANLVLAEQDITDKFFRKLVVGTGAVTGSGAATSVVQKENHQIETPKVESQQQQYTLRIGASSSKSTAISSSPKLLKELFAGLDTLATASLNNMDNKQQQESSSSSSTVNNSNSSEEETIFDTAPDYGRDDMYSDLSDDNSLEEVFASLNDVESFANESKTIKTTAAVIAATTSNVVPCTNTKNESFAKEILKIAPNQIQQPSLSILSPSSFREHMLQIRRDNDNIRDDILRFRSTLKLLKEENLTIIENRTTYVPPSSARM